GSSVHAYKVVNEEGDYSYVQLHRITLQGVKNLAPREAVEVQSTDSNNITRDLIESISKGDFPTWDLYMQVIEPEDLDNFDYNPLDATKIWPDVPERKVGSMVLNRNPANVFQETEQVAMAPANTIPGIEPSEDRMLQGRLFSYADTQMYRLGANHQHLPINQAKVAVNNNNQDGAMNTGARTGEVNYEPSR